MYNQDPSLPPGVTNKMIDDFFGEDYVSKCCGTEYDEEEGQYICCRCGEVCGIEPQAEHREADYDSYCDYLNDRERDDN